jgi:aminopeptidase N
MRRTFRLVAAGVTVACMAALSPAASAASAPAFTPGASGLGDPYLPLEGNGGYDVQHYGIDFSYDPASKRLDATTTITARATQDLSSFDLDLQQLDVSGVTVNLRKAGFTRDGQELVITPAKGLRRNSVFVVAVKYSGVPQTIVGSPIVFGSPYGFVHTNDGAFMGDEPNASSTWFPSNDHPSDKAAYTFRVTVPEGLGAVANGRLLSKTTKNGKSTFVWDERAPMATYLATADIGKWIFKSGRTPGGIPQTIAVDPQLNGRSTAHPDAVQYYWDTTAEATDLWDKTFGPYAFDSTGAIADLATLDGRTIGFSLETQTRPLYSDVRSTTTIAHELAHQWFGDAITVRDWSNIWLNESFATFAEWLWNEKHGGRTLPEQARVIYNGHPDTDTWWSVVISDPQRDTMFFDRSYRGGGMVLQFLREKIGDDAFFKLLRTWYTTHKNSTATTAEFEALAKQVSGQNLDSFFTTWLHTPGKPPLPQN